MSTLALYNHNYLVRRPSEDARQYSYRAIKTSILRMLLKPGEKMSEIDFAHSLKISRTPVHDTFIKLSRENLVDLIPNQGAYVSKLNCKRIQETLWMYSELGKVVLQSIYEKKVTVSELSPLNYMLSKIEDCLDTNDSTQIARIIKEYYHQLYVLAGDMQHIWESLERTDGDFFRFLTLLSENPLIISGLLMELIDLTNSLLEKNYDKSCNIFNNHLTHISMFFEPIKQYNSNYFVDSNNKLELEENL